VTIVLLMGLLMGQAELRLALIVSQVSMGEFGSRLRSSDVFRSFGQLPDRRLAGSNPSRQAIVSNWRGV